MKSIQILDAKMRDKIALTILAISVAVVMVISCITPCIAVDCLYPHEWQWNSYSIKRGVKIDFEF